MASAVNGNTADITNSGTQFPFVNLPRFEISGHEARVRSGAEAIAWNPFVEESETEAWNAYIVKAQGWYNESLTTARILDSTAVPEISQTTSMHEFIWHIAPGVGATPAQYSGPYAPMWHCSPPPPAISFVNFDTLSEASVKALIPALMEAKDGVMSTTDVADSGLGHLMQSGSELPQYTKTQIVDRPYSFHVQPVFENLYDRESRMVGFLSSLVYWDVFMTNVLPEEVHNIIAILRNSCRQSFTFRVDGQTVSEE